MGVLDGKAFVFSGKFADYTRKGIEAFAKSHGARVVGSISSKADYLVAGAKMGESKRTSANRLGIPILTYDQFMEMIEPSAPESFWNTDADSKSSPEDFLSALEALEWSKFHPHRHGKKLRNLLLQHEKEHGVQKAHTFCSNTVKSHLKLIHPYGHDDEISSSDISPDGRWLATANWSSEDYYRGGVLQIWEVEQGRIVNQIRVGGGVGWPDYKGIEWSPDSSLVGLAFDTNGIGAWDPFDGSHSSLVDAYVTNGMSRPPWFSWSGDGTSIFIDCNIDHDWSSGEEPEEGRGCWIPIAGRRGHVGNLAEPGYLKDREDGTPEHVPEPTTCTPPSVGADWIVFPGLDDDTGRGRYYDRPPGSNHPLHHPDEGDLNLSVPVRMTFPVPLDGEEYWGIAFAEGGIVAPDDYDPSLHLNMSLGHKYAWPLTWADWVVQAPSLWHILQHEDAPVSGLVKYHFRDIEPPPEQSTATSWPPDLHKTHDDIAALAVQTLTRLASSWSYHQPEYLTEIALTEVLRDKPDSALDIVKNLPERARAWKGAELAFHCLKRGFTKQGKALVKIANTHFDDAPEYNICEAAVYLALCNHLLEKPRNTKKFAKLANEHRLPETNPGQHNWPVVGMYLMMDDIHTACDRFKTWSGFGHSSSLDAVMRNLVWYARNEDFERFISVCIETENVDTWKVRTYILERIIQGKTHSNLESLSALLPSYSNDIQFEALEVMEHDPEFLQQYLPTKFEGEPTYLWPRWLAFTSLHAPETARNVLEEHPNLLPTLIGLSSHNDSRYKTAYTLGKVHGALGASYDETLFEDLSAGARTSFLAGLAFHQDAEHAQTLLERACEAANDISGYYPVMPWHMICSAAHQSQTPNARELFKEAATRTMNIDKDLSMEAMVKVLAEDGHAELAHTAWMKIPPGSRRYRMTAIFRLLCQRKDYNGLYDLLMTLDASDLNNRGQNSVMTLQTLTRSRGYWF